MNWVLQMDRMKHRMPQSQALSPKVHAMLTLSQSAPITAHYKELDSSGKTFRDFKTLTKGRFPFVLSSRAQIYPAFYDAGKPKNPLIVKVTGGHVGNRTVGYISTKYTESGEVLCKNEIMLLIIDQITGRPITLPDWWKKRNGTKGSETSNWISQHRIQKLTPPEEALRYQVRVAGSEIDVHQHTHWVSYFKYAEDAIYHFAKRNMFKDHTHDSMNTDMPEFVELFYEGETFEGDLLDVLVWPTDDKIHAADNVINTQILKNKKAVFQSRFQYFKNDGIL